MEWLLAKPRSFSNPEKPILIIPIVPRYSNYYIFINYNIQCLNAEFRIFYGLILVSAWLACPSATHFCYKNFKTWKGLIFIKLMATGCSLPYFCSFVFAFLRSFDYGFTFTNTTWKNETGAAVETTLVGRCSLRQGLLKNQFFLGMSRRFSVEIFRMFTGNTIILKIASLLINIFFYIMHFMQSLNFKLASIMIDFRVRV